MGFGSLISNGTDMARFRSGRGSFIQTDYTMFFDRKKIESIISKREKRVYSTFGAYVRREARKIVKPAKRLAVSKLSPKQRKKYDKAKATGKPDPRPYVRSKPYDPPKHHPAWKEKGIRWIEYFWSEYERAVTVHTHRLGNSNVPEILEYGGQSRMYGRPVNVAPRPFLWRAYENKEKELPNLWMKYRET